MWRVAFAALAAASSSDLLSQEITALEEVIASAQSKVRLPPSSASASNILYVGDPVGHVCSEQIPLFCLPLCHM